MKLENWQLKKMRFVKVSWFLFFLRTSLPSFNQLHPFVTIRADILSSNGCSVHFRPTGQPLHATHALRSDERVLVAVSASIFNSAPVYIPPRRFDTVSIQFRYSFDTVSVSDPESSVTLPVCPRFRFSTNRHRGWYILAFHLELPREN